MCGDEWLVLGSKIVVSSLGDGIYSPGSSGEFLHDDDEVRRYSK